MRLAVIPARGGSKRIPRKNIKSFAGKPIIGHSIYAALQSDCFDKVIVSTDDTEIADVARDLGAEVPFVRPDHLSNDFAGTIDVVCHAIDEVKEQGFDPAHICCIYATAPFITPRVLQDALQLLLGENVDYCFPVGAFSAPIQRALKLDVNSAVEMFDAETRDTRSQDLTQAYHDAGQFYWGKVDAWLKHKPVFEKNSRAIVLPSYRVQDIDTLDDWIRAELMFDAIRMREVKGGS
jgi:N-acylneuraminate cytidylyltransferase